MNYNNKKNKFTLILLLSTFSINAGEHQQDPHAFLTWSTVGRAIGLLPPKYEYSDTESTIEEEAREQKDASTCTAEDNMPQELLSATFYEEANQKAELLKKSSLKMPKTPEFSVPSYSSSLLSSGLLAALSGGFKEDPKCTLLSRLYTKHYSNNDTKREEATALLNTQTIESMREVIKSLNPNNPEEQKHREVIALEILSKGGYIHDLPGMESATISQVQKQLEDTKIKSNSLIRDFQTALATLADYTGRSRNLLTSITTQLESQPDSLPSAQLDHNREWLKEIDSTERNVAMATILLCEIESIIKKCNIDSADSKWVVETTGRELVETSFTHEEKED